MEIKTRMLWRLLAGSLITMPLASYAETESMQLDVEMGLAKAITFSCDTPLSFGVTRIPLKGGSAGKITLNTEGNISSIQSLKSRTLPPGGYGPTTTNDRTWRSAT